MDTEQPSPFRSALAPTFWRIHRMYCPSCHDVKVCVREVEVEEVRCDCGGICTPDGGDLG